MKSYILALLVSLSLIACASTSKPDATQPVAQASAQPAKVEAAATGNANTATTEQALLLQLNKDSVYFDFDKSAVKSEFHALIIKQAGFLRANKHDTVTLAGNCDERGSAEYNLALGNRRAYAVSHELQLLGVSKHQIKLVSFGNEKPRLTCHDESCWKENRRVDFSHNNNN